MRAWTHRTTGWLGTWILLGVLPATAHAANFKPGTEPWSAAFWASGQLSGSDAVKPLGGSVDIPGTSGSGLGVGVQLRWKNVVVGALTDWNAYSFAYHETWVGGVLGGTFDLSPEVRVELDVSAGSHQLNQLGQEPWRTALSSDKTELPFLGVRPTLWLRLPSQMRAALGVWLDVRRDLRERTLTVRYQNDGESTQTRDVYKVGGGMTAVGLQLALEYEWNFGR
jgi:hypothetical protein